MTEESQDAQFGTWQTFPLSSEDLEHAQKAGHFRTRVKQFLKKHGRCFDKFTVVDHDSFIADLSENCILQKLRNTFDMKASSWKDDFDMKRIERILDEDRTDSGSLSYLQYFFYDRWDIRSKRKNGTNIFIDVKTALTQKKANSNWEFLIPKVQVDKVGKDLFILAYVHGTIESPEYVELIGCTTPAIVRGCPLVEKGSETKRGTTSRILNHKTILKEHYRTIETYLM